MKKNPTARAKKLALDTTTVRALTRDQIELVDGGMMSSVGTCSGCRYTYCDCTGTDTWV